MKSSNIIFGQSSFDYAEFVPLQFSMSSNRPYHKSCYGRSITPYV